MSDTDMSCPRCSSPMARATVGGIEVDQCTRCSGIWLDPGEGEPLTRPDAELEGVINLVVGSSTRIKLENLPCPRCGKTMQEERYAESLVTIDRCACGVWLDGGELDKIQTYRRSKLDDLVRQNPEADRATLERAFARIYFEVGKGK